MAKQEPSIGRVVHFVTNDGRHVPADIAAVIDDTTVNLFVKDDVSGVAGFERDIPIDAAGLAPHTWHWPEHVPAK
jgi:hypothetical protein